MYLFCLFVLSFIYIFILKLYFFRDITCFFMVGGPSFMETVLYSFLYLLKFSKPLFPLSCICLFLLSENLMNLAVFFLFLVLCVYTKQFLFISKVKCFFCIIAMLQTSNLAHFCMMTFLFLKILVFLSHPFSLCYFVWSSTKYNISWGSSKKAIGNFLRQLRDLRLKGANEYV